MLVPFLFGVILFFAALCVCLAFDNAMFKQENAFLLRRAQRAEWEQADAAAGQLQAEQDALSANAEAVEAQQKVDRLSAHVAGLLRRSAHDVHVAFQPRQTYHINRIAPSHVAASRQPERN